MSRRPHPYFGQLNRLGEACGAVPTGGRGLAPLMAPEDQQGVLWNAFRKDSAAA